MKPGDRFAKALNTKLKLTQTFKAWTLSKSLN